MNIEVFEFPNINLRIRLILFALILIIKLSSKLFLKDDIDNNLINLIVILELIITYIYRENK